MATPATTTTTSSSSTTTSTPTILVVSRYKPGSFEYYDTEIDVEIEEEAVEEEDATESNNDSEQQQQLKSEKIVRATTITTTTTDQTKKEKILTKKKTKKKKEKRILLLNGMNDEKNDNYDDFNHPRLRRALILEELGNCIGGGDGDGGNGSQNNDNEIEDNDENDDDDDNDKATATTVRHRNNSVQFIFETPVPPPPPPQQQHDNDIKNNTTSNILDMYVESSVTSKELINFLTTSWENWDQLGKDNKQDPMCYGGIGNSSGSVGGSGGIDNDDDSNNQQSLSPPLVPGNFALHREQCQHQRPSTNAMGQIGYYCTDIFTPIFQELYTELTSDASIMEYVIKKCYPNTTTSSTSTTVSTSSSITLPPPPPPRPTAIYALGTHPGHHAAYDSFGGYCYINHAALLAKQLQLQLQKFLEENDNGNDTVPARVAILDVDYHCGNGTASIFYDNPNILVISIHCDPNHEYPFHSGYFDQIGDGDGIGTTLHLPLPPGTKWDTTTVTPTTSIEFGGNSSGVNNSSNSATTCEDNSSDDANFKCSCYKQALVIAMKRIQEFHPNAGLVVSLGLDTHADDPCALRRAGFQLAGNDYYEMGQVIGSYISDTNCDSNSNEEAGSCGLSSTATIPAIFVQEGGYYLEKVPQATKNVLVGFATAASSSSEVLP